MSLANFLMKEFTEEIASTRRILKRVPEDKLSWTPHQKSMSLGQLAMHIAIIPGELSNFFSELSREIPSVPLREATSLYEILTTLDNSEEMAKKWLSTWSNEDLMAEWKMTKGNETIMSAPRMLMVRSIMLNHWYHHRGQLTVYLRLLDLPVPAIYGPSADEDSFD
ncbi:DinB family protein [Evansella halocellulosilytica]|uniref:DinB family protein n=1 Tax=Evansella halocellulosilytica TaxID=2011013 RepID=UPI000BB83BFC|nr:DinB family protein [Evansella halocellulosilytica]